MAVMIYVMPWQNFTQKNIPNKIDYSKNNSWIAHPQNLNLSKFLPFQAKVSDSRNEVAVFFVHPTTYINRQNWNQPKNDYQANDILRKRILMNQAVIFSACCEVYVPRYRQATLYSFVAKEKNSKKAFQVAYQDVRDSFKYFNENFRNDRPFILAGHSQGSMHALRLLKELQNEKELYSQMVAAYLVGYSISKSDIFPSRVCNSDTSINCVIAWNSIELNGFVTFKGREELICVNPLTWNESDLYVSRIFNLGGAGFDNWFDNKDSSTLPPIQLESNVAGAKCSNGNLEITNLISNSFPVRLFSLHAYDYGLFFLNILENTKKRSEIFLGLN